MDVVALGSIGTHRWQICPFLAADRVIDELNLSNNRLTGRIPDEFGSLARLRKCWNSKFGTCSLI